jgi:hypothetical protein
MWACDMRDGKSLSVGAGFSPPGLALMSGIGGRAEARPYAAIVLHRHAWASP